MEMQTTQFSEKIQAWLVSYLAELLEIEPSEVDETIPFDRYGLDSSSTMSMTADLEEWLGFELDPMLFYDYPTIERLSQHLAQESERLPTKSVANQE